MTSLYREPEARQAPTAGALELRDVFRIFGTGEAETVALRGLDLRVEAGELLAVIGPSGSGKSTMLRLAAGLDVPSAGDVRAFGRSLVRLTAAELASYRAHEVAVVFQRGNLHSSLTAAENVSLSMRLAGRRPGRHEAVAALAEFGLEPAAGRRPQALSGGEQQRVAVAAAAARAARLVLADEPTAELDEQSEGDVLAALGHLRERGATVVVVTHSGRVAEWADRVIEIRDGRVA